MASGSDERQSGATSQHPGSPFFRLSALVRDSQVSLNFNKGDLFENPSGCQRNSPFPHHQSTPGKLQKKSKYHWLPQRGGGGSSAIVGLLRTRSGRKGQKKRASLLSNRDINKDLLAARNLALKPCKTTWSERAYCLLGYKSTELDVNQRPLCSLQRSIVSETRTSLSFSYLEDGHKAMICLGAMLPCCRGINKLSTHTSSHSSDKWRAPTTYRHYARYQRIRQEWNKFAICLRGIQNLSMKNMHESNSRHGMTMRPRNKMRGALKMAVGVWALET